MLLHKAKKVLYSIIILIYICNFGSKYQGRARPALVGASQCAGQNDRFFSINKTKDPGALEKGLRPSHCKSELKIKKQSFFFVSSSMSKEHKIEKNTNLLKTLLTWEKMYKLEFSSSSLISSSENKRSPPAKTVRTPGVKQVSPRAGGAVLRF